MRQDPDHTGNLGLDWQASELVSANLAWQYVGSQVIKVPTRNSQAFTSKRYQTLDVNTNWTVTPALDFKLGITNLTNTQRDEVATDADFILEGRTVYAGVDLQAVSHPAAGAPSRGAPFSFLPARIQRSCCVLRYQAQLFWLGSAAPLPADFSVTGHRCRCLWWPRGRRFPDGQSRLPGR